MEVDAPPPKDNNILNLPKKEVKKALSRMKNGFTRGNKVVFPKAERLPTGCLLCQKKGNKSTADRSRGWIKCKVGSSSKREYYIHHLALLAADRGAELGQVFIGRNPDQVFTDRKQVSHLCHNPICFNEEHLIVETASENLERNMCKGWKNDHLPLSLWTYI